MRMYRKGKTDSLRTYAVYHKTLGRCGYCGKGLTMDSGRPNTFTVDHVLAERKNGSSGFGNLLPACRSCNSRKGTRSIEQFRNTMRALEMQRHGAPKFTEAQIKWLDDRGCSVLSQFPPSKFYFETLDTDGCREIAGRTPANDDVDGPYLREEASA